MNFFVLLLCHAAGTVGAYGYSEQDVPQLIQLIEQQKALQQQLPLQQQQLYLQQQALVQSQNAATLGGGGQAGGMFAANMPGAAQPVAQIPFADQARLLANARESVSACYALAIVSPCTFRSLPHLPDSLPHLPDCHTSLPHLPATPPCHTSLTLAPRERKTRKREREGVLRMILNHGVGALDRCRPCPAAVHVLLPSMSWPHD